MDWYVLRKKYSFNDEFLKWDLPVDNLDINLQVKWERSGSVVECLTQDRRAVGWSLIGVTVLWSLSKTHLS